MTTYFFFWLHHSHLDIYLGRNGSIGIGVLEIPMAVYEWGGAQWMGGTVLGSQANLFTQTRTRISHCSTPVNYQPNMSHRTKNLNTSHLH
jgi:hypothetical protein